MQMFSCACSVYFKFVENNSLFQLKVKSCETNSTHIYIFTVPAVCLFSLCMRMHIYCEITYSKIAASCEYHWWLALIWRSTANLLHHL